MSNQPPDHIVEWFNPGSEAAPYGYIKCRREDADVVITQYALRYGKNNVHLYQITEVSFDYFPARVELLAR
jgi:hypothetical protein